jgi:hypothetical protein
LVAVQEEVRMLTTLALMVAAPVPAVDYQKRAEETAWKWKDDAATVGHSFLVHQNSFDVKLERKVATGDITITFAKDGKTLYTIPGHAHTVFRINGDTLVFARYHFSASGATIVAVDLPTGKELWATRLEGLGPIQHSAYRNLLNLDAQSDVVTVFGNESQGRYVEILDAKTGKTVGHKVFPEEKKGPQRQR